LARLADEEEDLIESQEFLGAAIHNGLVQRLDKWSVRQATSAIGEHRRAGHVLNFFVHLAEDSVRDPGLIVWICDCLRDFDVRGSWLTFVFQEALVETDRVPLTRLIDGLRKIKCRVAMNRFGASQEPEALLQGIPVDFVLFQPEYAQGLADDAKKQKRLIELANLAREHNVKSVVTGVEEARTLTILWNAGVDYVQGNFLQRPTSTLEAPASA
jgi:EAL domain-containing protein (putative c-di-GMP-specific phosphodiesterase class I)